MQTGEVARSVLAQRTRRCEWLIVRMHVSVKKAKRFHAALRRNAGHLRGKDNMSWEEEEARSRQVQVVMFGHTHYPYLEEMEDLTVLNPGSLSYPRQPGRKPSYLVMEIDEQGKAHYEHRYLEKA